MTPTEQGAFVQLAYPGITAVIHRIHRQRTEACLKREYEKQLAACDAQHAADWRVWAIQEATVYARERIQRRYKPPTNRKARKAAKRVCVAIYDCNRSYGGPEEGGWWYDTGSLVSVESVHFNRSRAIDAHLSIADYCARQNEGKRPIYSVLCDGVLMVKIMPYPAPAGFPERTPRYE